jgi:hypothetical protein
MLVHKTSYGACSLAVIHGILYHIRFPGPRGYSPKTMTGFEFLVRSAAGNLDPTVQIAKMPGNTCHFERIPRQGQAPIPVAAIRPGVGRYQSYSAAMQRKAKPMQNLMAFVTAAGISATLVGCGGETPSPPAGGTGTNTSTELGAPADLTAPDQLDSGSGMGAEGGDLGIPPDGGTDGTPAESGTGTEEGASTDGPALPGANP